jgi:peroxiredoxin
VQLHRAREQFDDAGVSLVLIGQGSPRQADRFRSRWEVELPVLADGERESYRAAGAKVATMAELLGPTSARRGVVKTFGSGGRIRQGRVIGHPAQLGGAMVIRPDGAVSWSHMSEDPSDNASPEELLEAARSAD